MRLYVVDAFASKAFEGGPAGVVFLQKFLEDDLLLNITAELNHSNTAFLVPLENDPNPWINTNRFAIRWFARHNEVFLCGHATLAAGHVLFSIGNRSQEIILEPTCLDPLLVRRGKDDYIVLDFPQNMPSPLSSEQRKGFDPLIKELSQGFKVLDVLLYGSPVKKLLVRLEDGVKRGDLEKMKVDPKRLQESHPKTPDFAGVTLTVKGELEGAGDKGFHFYSRYFAPWNGIPEDPATGSAHTLLGPYWSSHLGLKQLKSRQCSARGAEFLISLREDGRMDISGKAVTIIDGEFHL